jgi:hypothetical protein
LEAVKIKRPDFSYWLEVHLEKKNLDIGFLPLPTLFVSVKNGHRVPRNFPA